LTETKQGFWSTLWYGAPKDNGKNPQLFSNDNANAIVIPSRSAVGLSTEAALSMEAVVACVRVIVTTGSSLTFNCYREGKLIDTPAIAWQPDPDRSRTDFLGRTLVNLSTLGEAFWMVEKSASGVLKGIRNLDPNGVRVHFSNDGTEKYYDVPGVDGKTRTYNDGEVVHLRLFELPGHVNGLGPIQLARAGVMSAKNLRDSTLDVITKVPDVILSTDQLLDAESAEQHQLAYRRQMETGQGPFVAGQGVNVSKLNFSPADLQFLENAKYNDAKISTLFGVPPAIINVPEAESSYTYTGEDSLDRRLYKYCLKQYLDVIAAAFSAVLPRGTVAEFDLDPLINGDPRERAEVDEIRIRSGVVTVDELRKRDGLPPLPKPKPAPAPVAVEPPTDPEPDVIPTA
jgi:HK97 family phage portal protein